MVQGYLTAVRYHAVYELQFFGMQGQRGIAAVEASRFSFGNRDICLSNTLYSCSAMTALRQPVAPKYLEKEYTQSVLYGISAMNERKCG